MDFLRLGFFFEGPSPDIPFHYVQGNIWGCPAAADPLTYVLLQSNSACPVGCALNSLQEV
jgi:hypothetical protein